MKSAIHPDPVELARYACGELSHNDAARLRVHCERCETCGGMLTALTLLRTYAPEDRGGAQDKETGRFPRAI